MTEKISSTQLLVCHWGLMKTIIPPVLFGGLQGSNKVIFSITYSLTCLRLQQVLSLVHNTKYWIRHTCDEQRPISDLLCTAWIVNEKKLIQMLKKNT